MTQEVDARMVGAVAALDELSAHVATMRARHRRCYQWMSESPGGDAPEVDILLGEIRTLTGEIEQSTAEATECLDGAVSAWRGAA